MNSRSGANMVRRKRWRHSPENSPSKRRRRSQSECRSRRWIISSKDSSNCTDKIVVVSYNILGVQNASNHPDLYSNIPHRFLEWDKRKRLILEEINNYNASILCFQEVDHFNDLDNLFKNSGFKGTYKARTGEAKDGCAVFWKDELFNLLHQEDIEFQRFGMRNNVAQLCILEGNHDKKESNACNLTTMEPSTGKRRFVVGNIHVLFNPNRGDIKLGQVRLLLDKAYKLSQEWGNIPVIIAGDLNSVPQSAIYKFLSSSKLDIQLHDRRNMSGQLEIQSNRLFRSQIRDDASISMTLSRQLLYRWSVEELRIATGAKGITQLQHQLKLRSAYSGVPGDHRTRDDIGEPLATSYHSKFMGTVDYIWHSDDLVPLRVLETLPIDILRRSGGLPSEKWGSDHLAVVCELAFSKQQQCLRSEP
ncbi:Carbon catabolite repressor protein [Vigna angularis]|uniref:Carbon catabolite repressor protein n=1 Tax=Phaseolus angularis TaxID=3914 RepID=A0A8T0JX94_PHAAN|nr:carbon catabolite repressor protein 4 homolog 5 isoform X2 [Vigna angularis]KAG2385208.1 Carbon catabolite repressor protein [Vigna angularis]